MDNELDSHRSKLQIIMYPNLVKNMRVQDSEGNVGRVIDCLLF